MDFVALRYFFETARSRSIRAASERLHVSPSAISRQIAKLEHELRAPVFHRRPEGMRLTAAGELLQAEVEGIMREFARVKSHIAALQNLQSGTIDVFCFQTATESFLAPVLSEFHAQHPNVVFNIKMSSTDDAIKALITGLAEISLVVNPPYRDGIANTEIFRDAIVAVFGPKHPLGVRKSLSLQELADFSFVQLDPSFGLRQQVDKTFERHAIDPAVFCVTNSIALAKSMASFDNVCAMLPLSIVEKEADARTLSIVAVDEFKDDRIIFSLCKLEVPVDFARGEGLRGLRYRFLPSQSLDPGDVKRGKDRGYCGDALLSP